MACLCISEFEVFNLKLRTLKVKINQNCSQDICKENYSTIFMFKPVIFCASNFKLILIKNELTNNYLCRLKFIYSEKALKFCKISPLLLTGTTQDKSKIEISQNFVAFPEYMNFNQKFGFLKRDARIFVQSLLL